MTAVARLRQSSSKLMDSIIRTPEPSEETPRFPKHSLWVSVLAFGVGLSGFIGWIAHQPALLKGHPFSSEMPLRTAAIFLTLGSCFFEYFRRQRPADWPQRFRVAGAVTLCLCAINTLDVVGAYSALSRWLHLRASFASWVIQIPMDPFMLYVVAFLGVATAFWPRLLMLSDTWRSALNITMTVVFIGLLVIILGYVYHAPFEMIPTIRPAPFLSTLGCAMLSLCMILSLGTDTWPLRPFRGQKTQARLMRTFLPLASLSVVTYAILSQYVFAFLNPAISSIIAILSSTAIGVVVISRASRIVSLEIDRASENLTHQFIELVDSMKVHMMYMLSLDGHVLSWSPAAERLKGYRADEILGKHYSIFFTPEDISTELPSRTLRQALIEGMVTREGWRIRKDGSRFRADVALSLVRDSQGHAKGFVKVVRDVTDRWKHEQLLEASLKEKELLLKEIHHRVKNNLQIVASLLRMQSRKLTDPTLLQNFRESQSRVQAMALIHEYLYESKDLANINFQSYLENVVSGLLRSYSIGPDEITGRVEAQGIRLHLDLAAPCGLIVTELITNSMKYAFPNKRLGFVTVSCRYIAPQTLCLTVSDNGVGLPENFHLEASQSLGLQLVKSLARQLNAEMSVTSAHGKGVQYSFEFKGPSEKEIHL